MSFLELAKARYSVRSYRADAIEKEKMEKEKSKKALFI